MKWYDWAVMFLGLFAYSGLMFLLGFKAGRRTEMLETAIDRRVRPQFTLDPQRCGFCGEHKHYSPKRGWHCLVCGYDDKKGDA